MFRNKSKAYSAVGVSAQVRSPQIALFNILKDDARLKRV